MDVYVYNVNVYSNLSLDMTHHRDNTGGGFNVEIRKPGKKISRYLVSTLQIAGRSFCASLHYTSGLGKTIRASQAVNLMTAIHLDFQQP